MGFISLAGMIIPGILKIIDKVIPDKALAAKTKLEIIKLQHQGKLKEFDLLERQIEVNREEAKSDSLFVSGWRPFVGWSCAISVITIAVILPTIAFILALFGVVVPPIGVDPMIGQILLGMLGIGYMGARSFDKAKKHRRIDRRELFSKLRADFGSLTQAQVDAVLAALEEIE